MMTSSKANSPYSVIDLQSMISLTNTIKKSVKKGQRGLLGSVCSIGRFMYIFGRPVEPGAQLEPEKSAYRRKSKHTPLIALLSPLLFFALDTHLTSLEKVWCDGLLSNERWHVLITKLNIEWQDFLLNATVLLNANVAFLAIQSGDESSTNEGRSLPQILSYISVIGSIGCILLDLFLLGENRPHARDSQMETSSLNFYLRESALETLAIMYSLPWALLMWAMLSFSLAFSLMCFTASDLAVRMSE
ncbi:hypothetical protein DFS33DRAFT_1487877 [Desarmillaria ectypa]|nr:hypothetical protein DFS33DRAFT_1487877 [Desarmillaria ectypa]